MQQPGQFASQLISSLKMLGKRSILVKSVLLQGNGASFGTPKNTKTIKA
jgi:hypothetical protein